MNKRKLFIGLFFIFLYSNLLSQNTIWGRISNTKGEILPSVNVLIKQDSSQKVLTYTYSNEKGEYRLRIKQQGHFVLVVSSLAYQKISIPIVVDDSQQEIRQDIQLEETAFEIDEVVIKEEKIVLEKEDTVRFKTKYFTNGSEKNVEELLTKIPGIQIDDKGTITIGNREIEKIMIDGDDFFEKGYKILSKNMPAYPIEEVEILNNFSNNSLLKNIEESEKVALNLKINEKQKRIWFGNIKASLGNDFFHEINANLMNFGRKNKFYFLNNFNNIGYDATGELSEFINPSHSDDIANIGNNQSVKHLLSLSTPQLIFRRSKTNFNQDKMASLNAIFNPSKKLKIKALTFFNHDEINFHKQTQSEVQIDSTQFNNKEALHIYNKDQIAFGKLNINYKMNRNSEIESVTKYKKGNDKDGSSLNFNDIESNEILNNKHQLFDQKLNYTQKLKNKMAILLTGRFIKEDAPQDYKINRFFFQDLFPQFEQTNQVQQDISNEMLFAGFSAHLFKRFENKHLAEIQIGKSYRKDKLHSTFSLLENETILNQASNYKNNTKYTVNDLYLKSKYIFQLEKWSIVGALDFHQLVNTLDDPFNPNAPIQEQKPFFVNPSLGLSWNISKRNKINLSYNYNSTNAEILDLYSNFILSSFRSLTKGNQTLNQFNRSALNLSHEWGNWSDRFLAHSFLTYGNNHNMLSHNSFIQQNYILSEKMIIKNMHFFIFHTKLEYYFKSIRNNLRFKLRYSYNEYQNKINGSQLREVHNNNSNFGIELRSAFAGFFNYHIGNQWINNRVKSTTEQSFKFNISFIELFFTLTAQIDAKVQLDYYFFNELQKDKQYFFLDLELRYRIIKNKLNVSFMGKNLLNTEEFRLFSINDFSYSTSQYQLLPRMLLLKVEYRF